MKGSTSTLAEQVSQKMSFHHQSQLAAGDIKGIKFIENMFTALEGSVDPKKMRHNVRHKRQLKIVGPSNNGKSELAQWMARMWVASASGHEAQGGWIETYVTMETMEAHLWSARESTGAEPREVWGPLRYLFYKSWEFPRARFALVLHESNRGGLFNALNRIWWEKRRNYTGQEVEAGSALANEHLPPNLALIFTENPKTADYATIGDGDEALRTRLTPKSTFALVCRDTDRDELKELLGDLEKCHFVTESVGLIYAATNGHRAKDSLLAVAAGGGWRDAQLFAGHFGGIDIPEFRSMPAGQQIEIVCDHMQEADGVQAPAPALAPAAAPRPLNDLVQFDRKHKKSQKELDRSSLINKFLWANQETAQLSFIYPFCVNKNQSKTIRQYYEYLRNKMYQDHAHFHATVGDIIRYTGNLEHDNSDLFAELKKTKDVEQASIIRLLLAAWIGIVQFKEFGPSVRIRYGERDDYKWDEFLDEFDRNDDEEEDASAAGGGGSGGEDGADVDARQTKRRKT